jgi:two-component system response regulator AlgR
VTLAQAGVPRILIADDEAPARSRLRDLLDDCRAEFPLVVVDEARTGREALEIVSREKLDIVLLDIRMPQMDGLEVARHMAGMPNPPAIIFTTAFDAYALKAFEVNAIDYLLKPIRAERLLTALRKARAAVPGPEALAAVASQPRKHLCVHERGRLHLVPLADVLYLRAELKYVTVRTAAREHVIEESLTRFEEEFGSAFVRIHRNCLVARSAIEGFEKGAADSESGWVAVIRGTGERLAVSRRQQHVVKEFRGDRLR